MKNTARSTLTTVLAAACAALASQAVLADEIGYDDLVARLGGVGVPSGSTVPVAHCEANDGSGNYGPDQSNSSEFGGTTFTAMSGAPGNSGHATVVAYYYYGNLSSIAPGVSLVWLYEANGFLQGNYLKVGQPANVLPLLPPGGLRTFNCSWIGSFGSVSPDNDGARRADYAMNRDDTLFMAALNNGTGTPPPLMSYIYNGLSVGREDGQHSYGFVPGGGYDGAGRMKPEVVAPGSATSWATPVASSVAVLLYDTANTPPYNSNPNMKKGVVIKSAIMAGANHRPGWTNNPATSGPTRGVTSHPLDTIYGADLVNINNSHWILTSLEQEGQTTVPAAPTIGPRGWDYRSMSANTTFYYRFRITQLVPAVSILATWERNFGSTISAGTPGNIDLTLYQASGTSLISLVGDAGLPVFGGGNVVSNSTVDNVEHLYVQNLQPGDYVIEMKRIDGLTLPVNTCLSWIMPDTPALTGDLNNDGHVDGADLGILIGNWGGGGVGDINGDGIVDGADLGALIGHWTG